MSLLSLFFQDPFVFLAIILVFLIALSVHEFSHAWAATLLGDQTAKRMKRLTLNPLAHIDVMGFLTLILVGFGWGKPVPFNPYNLKYPRWGPAMIAAAGPISNLILGTIAALAYRFLLPVFGESNLLTFFLSQLAYLNYLLMLFNFIPLPPLDGSKALLALLAGEQFRQARTFIETQGPLLLMGLVVLDIGFGVGIFGFLSKAVSALLAFVTTV